MADDHRIWNDPRKNAPWENEAHFRKTTWLPLCTRAGIRYRNPYQMRHTFASTHLTAGANPYWLSHRLGDVDVKTVNSSR